MTWLLSFCDPERPRGTQFLGVVFIEASGFGEALRKSHALGVNPGGEVQGMSHPLRPAPEYLDRLLTRDEGDLACESLAVGEA